MEYTHEHGLLDELLALRPDPLMSNFQIQNNIGQMGFDYFDENPVFVPPNPSFQGNLSLPFDVQTLDNPLGDDLLLPEAKPEATLFQRSMPMINELYPIHQPSDVPVTNLKMMSERKKRVRKVEGQPSKNLMAERRRRKRLNDRLSMLRSIVPKISKMDRTSILGDTVDYMKDLLERINNLQEEIEVGSSNDELKLVNILKDLKPNEVLGRNSPKFDVERRNMETMIEICCTPKPNLLLSTVATLETLGLEIQHCVISCFHDFSMEASCSELEELEQRAFIGSEEVKQALFRNAGYGGRCL
ncbi:Transcription factor bHLH93 like [Actinidia chinensis var. chinensis]|uniref:Transcription factor bHLH93 like n=1 Tax=Actinidia chinensis var. chinensis TaxID=1590841 RepID=A0A2R6R380_ACTCC|nr:Transcription factor bHLH93 like [Actinidia chinensis var. chinensis]